MKSALQLEKLPHSHWEIRASLPAAVILALPRFVLRSPQQSIKTTAFVELAVEHDGPNFHRIPNIVKRIRG